jgi:cytochrome c oxidase subunit 1
MHFLGLNGMPRRIYTYDADLGWNLWNFVSTCGALLLGLSIAWVVLHLVLSIRRGKIAGNDPWHGRTLEWSIPSPPPEYNFASIPVVRARDAHWHDKHTDAPAPKHPNAAHERAHGVHMPDQSWWPPVASFGILLAGMCMIFKGRLIANLGELWFLCPLVGVALLFVGAYMWALEGPAGYHVIPKDDPADTDRPH